jgi:glycosyltransferase involved in cell wall biosynthesis
MKKAIIVHDSLNYCGGAEKFSLETIKALINLGYSVGLRTIERTNWDRVRKIFGYVPKLYEEFFLTHSLYFPRTYKALFSLALKRRKEPSSLMFNTNGDVIPTTFDDFTYVHIPSSLSLVTRDPEIDNVGFSWDLYFAPHRIIWRTLKHFDDGAELFTNSQFSRSKIELFWGRDAKVLYPPVDINLYSCMLGKYERQDIVVTISRFDTAKNLSIIPWIASKSKVKKFIILGSVTSKNQVVVKMLEEKARRYGVTEKLQIIQNATLTEKRKILGHAKVLFHPKRFEHFGISIVEGMASGCIPVVYDTGGPKEFVPRRYRAECTDQIPTMIDEAVSSWNLTEARWLSSLTNKFNPLSYQNVLSAVIKESNHS